jgi:hypothetical protein
VHSTSGGGCVANVPVATSYRTKEEGSRNGIA